MKIIYTVNICVHNVTRVDLRWLLGNCILNLYPLEIMLQILLYSTNTQILTDYHEDITTQNTL